MDHRYNIFVDNESNDSGLSSETSQNSKERQNNSEVRNVSSMRAVNFALSNHRKMSTVQRYISSSSGVGGSSSNINNNINRGNSSNSNISNQSLTMKEEIGNIRSKHSASNNSNSNNSSKTKSNPYLVKINPKSAPCCEYLIEGIQQLQLPMSEQISEVGCEMDSMKRDIYDQSEDDDSVTCKFDNAQESDYYFESDIGHLTSSQTTIFDYTPQTYGPPIQSQCLHSLLRLLDYHRSDLASFRLVMSTRNQGTRIMANQKNKLNGLLVVDLLHAEGLSPPPTQKEGDVPSLTTSAVRLMMCSFKLNCDLRADSSAQIYKDRIIWEERFLIELRSTDFLSVSLYQQPNILPPPPQPPPSSQQQPPQASSSSSSSSQSSNSVNLGHHQYLQQSGRRLSHYGGLSILDLVSQQIGVRTTDQAGGDSDTTTTSISVDQNQQPFGTAVDQVVLQLEPRGLLYLQLAFIPLHNSLSRGAKVRLPGNLNTTTPVTASTSSASGATSTNSSNSRMCCSINISEEQNNPRFCQGTKSLSDWIYVLRWCISALNTYVDSFPQLPNLYKICVSEEKICICYNHIICSRVSGTFEYSLPEPNVLCTMIILCLREMPHFLVTKNTMIDLQNLSRHVRLCYDPNGQILALEAIKLLKTLPQLNQMALMELFDHLYLLCSIRQNKCDLHFLAVTLAPLIFYESDNVASVLDDNNDGWEEEVFKCLLINWSCVNNEPVAHPHKYNEIVIPHTSKIPKVSIAVQTDNQKLEETALLPKKLTFEEYSKSPNYSSKTGLSYKSILKNPMSKSYPKQNECEYTSQNSNTDYENDRSTFI